MDQQNKPRPAPTPEEIARLEAEAVAALQRGEEPKRPEPQMEAPSSAETPGQAGAEAPVEANPQPEFVPYVDDVVPSRRPTGTRPTRTTRSTSQASGRSGSTP